MVFSSVSFLFVFLPAALAAYFLVPRRFRRARNIALLLASLAFYFCGEPVGFFVMAGSIVINYALALGIGRGRGRGILLWTAAAANLAVIGFYKYTGFLLENINPLFAGRLLIPDIVMPIGISFFTFQGMSYVFDVYSGRVRAARRIEEVAAYISMFPQLVAGPIVRYETVAAELYKRRETVSSAAAGIRRFVFGLSKKMLLANALGEIAGEVFAADPSRLPAPVAWIGAAAYGLQIFFDFSGYSDMAIGLGLIFGFRFPENFDYPYISGSVTEFWRRWHISLGTWFRDYVYIPLGGSRRGLPRQIFNIAVVWALTGLWHGASWNFVVWGLYFAVFLTAEKLFLLKALARLPRAAGVAYTLTAVLFGWVIFESPGLSHAASYAAAMFGAGASGEAFPAGQAIYYLRQYRIELAAALICCAPVVPALRRRFGERAWYAPASAAAAGILFALSVMRVVASSFNPFIYFRF